MKKILILVLTAFLMVGGTTAHGQNFVPLDTIFDLGSYKSCYSYNHQAPSFVVYKLYRPKSNVKRDGLAFKAYHGLPHFNYTRSGYDRGHLVAAADRAASLEEMRQTFYFVNVIPQTPELNRGRWKYYESIVRELAQYDSLLIVCGGADYADSAALVPATCYKVVYSMTDQCAIMALLFSNSSCVRVWDCRECLTAFPYAWVYSLWKGGGHAVQD